MKILVVDDSRAMRMIIKRSLRRAGFGHHSVEEAADGAEALARIRAPRPDVVLCDWNMPVMNGMELLCALREDESPVRFGFVTSESTSEMRRRAIAAGASFLLAKPFTVESMEEALGPILS